MKTKTTRHCLATVILFIFLKGRGPHPVMLRDLALHSEITSGGAWEIIWVSRIELVMCARQVPYSLCISPVELIASKSVGSNHCWWV